MTQNLRAKVFISCGQRKGTNEESIANQIAQRLRDKGFETYTAIEQQTLKDLKKNIFNELSSSEYFLFIDFRREELVGATKKQTYRGSLFCHQELALASFLEMPLMAFQEEGVKSDDGILQFIQANCTRFAPTDRHLLSNTVAGKIDQEGWKPNWKNQLLMERKLDQFHDAWWRRTMKRARFFHITVRNLNPHKHARNCYAFLERIHDLSIEDPHPVRSVELKWAGYSLPYVTILPSSCREIDGFMIYRDSPNIARFNQFSDSALHDFSIPDIVGPGKYELTYLVISDNFEAIRSTFRLELGNDIDAASFEQVKNE